MQVILFGITPKKVIIFISNKCPQYVSFIQNNFIPNNYETEYFYSE